MLPFKEVVYAQEVPDHHHHILTADIGGSNSNFGIFSVSGKKSQLLFSLHFKSRDITNFTHLVQEIIEYVKNKYHITLKHACFAAAGVVSPTRDYCKPTNLSFVLDSREILRATNIKCAFIVNDFEVIGHSIPLVDQSKMILINKGKSRRKANRAIIGAGTGLGKCIMVWNDLHGHFMPLASEGGHADFAIQNQLELDLVQSVQQQLKTPGNISWEDILAGSGIQRIYTFLATQNHYERSLFAEQIEKNELHPDAIFAHKNEDPRAHDTFMLYTKFYARCAKNFALESLALGGVYIAGGIAAKNIDLFKQPLFMAEFINCAKHVDLLSDIPIHVVADYNISLYGAAQYMLQEEMCS